MHHTERGRFVVGAWRPIVSPFTGGLDPREMFCSLGGTGRVGTDSDSVDQARCTLSALRRPMGVWVVRAFMREIVSVGGSDTLRGSDTKHTAASSN